MTPILFTQPIPSQTDLAREVTRDGETTAPNSNAAKNDTFDTLLAEELLAAQSPVQQSAVVIQTAVLPTPATPTEEYLIPGNVSAGTDPVPGIPDFALQEGILSLPKGNQSAQYHDPVSGEEGISQMLPPNNESSAGPSLTKADVHPIVEHEESLTLSGTPPLGAASDSKLTSLSPPQQESGVAREGVAQAVTSHQIVPAEKPPLAFSVVHNPLRAEINPQPSAQQPAGPVSPVPFSKEEIGAQGEGVPLTPTVVRRETSNFGIAHTEAGPEHDATFLTPPPAEGRIVIRTLSQTPQVLQGVTSEKGEKGSLGKDNVKSVEMENSGSDDGNRAKALRSNDQRQAPEKQRVAAASDEPSDSAPEKAPENPQERQQLAGDEMKNPSGSLNASERTPVASVVNRSRSVPTEPMALPVSASLDAHESVLLSPRAARALMEQVKQALSLQMREQTTEVRIRLQPESLGTMVLSVQQDDAKVAAEIRVEHSAVKAAIDTHLPNLRQALQSQGIDFQRLEVVVADQSMGREFFHQAQPSQKRRARNSSLHATEAHEAFTPRSLGYNTLELLF